MAANGRFTKTKPWWFWLFFNDCTYPRRKHLELSAVDHFSSRSSRVSCILLEDSKLLLSIKVFMIDRPRSLRKPNLSFLLPCSWAQLAPTTIVLSYSFLSALKKSPLPSPLLILFFSRTSPYLITFYHSCFSVTYHRKHSIVITSAHLLLFPSKPFLSLEQYRHYQHVVFQGWWEETRLGEHPQAEQTKQVDTRRSACYSPGWGGDGGKGEPISWPREGMSFPPKMHFALTFDWHVRVASCLSRS